MGFCSSSGRAKASHRRRGVGATYKISRCITAVEILHVVGISSTATDQKRSFLYLKKGLPVQKHNRKSGLSTNENCFAEYNTRYESYVA